MITPPLLPLITCSKRLRRAIVASVCVTLFAGIAVSVISSVTGEYHMNCLILSEVEANHFDEVQRLLAQGADPNVTYWEAHSSYSYYVRSRTKARYIHSSRALTSAARNGNLPTVKLLLQYGAQVNLGKGCGNSELDYAEEKGLTEMISLLKQRGSKKNRVYVCCGNSF